MVGTGGVAGEKNHTLSSEPATCRRGSLRALISHAFRVDHARDAAQRGMKSVVPA